MKLIKLLIIGITDKNIMYKEQSFLNQISNQTLIPFEVDSVLTQYIAISLKTVLHFSEVKLALDCDAKIHKDFSTNNKINNKKVKLRKS